MCELHKHSSQGYIEISIHFVLLAFIVWKKWSRFIFFGSKININTYALVTLLTGTLKGLVIPIMSIIRMCICTIERHCNYCYFGKKTWFWHSVTFVRSLVLKLVHLIWHLNSPQMLYDFMFLINVNPKVAVRVVWFPCQSPDWENYVGNKEVMMRTEVSNSAFKLSQNLYLLMQEF